MSNGIAVRQSIIFLRAKVTALEIAVTPFNHSDRGMISFFRSSPNIASTGVAMNATPNPIIPDRNDNPNSTTDNTRYKVQPSTMLTPIIVESIHAEQYSGRGRVEGRVPCQLAQDCPKRRVAPDLRNYSTSVNIDVCLIHPRSAHRCSRSRRPRRLPKF